MGQAAPTTRTERALAEVLGEVLQVGQVSVDSHFFNDLGADSMVMAQFCARVRKRADLPSVSIKDVYQHPTVRNLAGALAPLPSSPSIETGLAEVLAEVLQVGQVSVDSHFFNDLGADSMVMAQFCARVRKRADLPSVSIKDVYQHPTVRNLAGALAPLPSSPSIETGLAEVLAEVLQVGQVSVDSHFFNDLGADSMVMAQFCARVRKRADLPSVSIKDVYRHPTVSGLAAAVADSALPAVESSVQVQTEVVRPTSSREYLLCGVLQFLFFLAAAYLTALIIHWSFVWISAGGTLVDDYLRSVLVGSVSFVVLCTLPILAKWVLIGRWKRQQIRIWSLAYFRFWVVKTLVRANPLVLFAGSPLFVLYLRALGAKIGRDVVILSRHLPVCTDLLTIGDGTVIRKDSYFTCYRARAGMIETGAVTLGKDVFVGENTVLDIETSMGDGAQLGQTSSLHTGQAVPDGAHWHGSPGQATHVDYRMVGPAECSSWRRGRYAVLQLLNTLLVILPLAFGGLAMLLLEVPWMAALLEPGHFALTSQSFYSVALTTSLVLYFGSLVIRFLVVVSVPRALNLAFEPDRVYRLYGIHYAFHRAIARITNISFFKLLTGDSSYIVPYLRAIGYHLSPVVQTGSNFGTVVKHETPYQSYVGSGTVVASGLTIMNADFSNSSFRVSRTALGRNNFLGNWIWYPSQGKTGDNCLLATKVLVPIDGDVRENVGLLGSPSFEIPRTVERDSRFAHLAHGEEFERRLRAKNRHNLVTIGYILLARWFLTFVLTLIGFVAVDVYDFFGAAAIAVANLLVLTFTVLYLGLVERASTGFRGVKPTYCSIYEVDFWRVERFFKLSAALPYKFFDGTPFKRPILRLLGVRVGKRVFDNGSLMDEKNIVTIGDDVTLNENTHIQCHSQEDYAFKSDSITIGSGCTVGVGAWVHYGVTMGEGSVLAPDSFLMKGEEMPPHARWGGNPAREMPETMRLVPTGRAAVAERSPVLVDAVRQQR